MKPPSSRGTNRRVADRLRAAAELLEQQHDNPFRVNAYRNAANTIRGLDRDLRDLMERGGPDALQALPGIGEGISGAIQEMLQTGRWSLLERLQGTPDPARLYQSLPGIGPTLARRIEDTLEVESLEELEMAAHDGRLEAVPGVGARRSAAIRAQLAQMLGRGGAQRRGGPEKGPPVSLLLDVDREYRERAEKGELRSIAPRRFNPEGRAWLPILHTRRADWNFTALYSNTARAHEAGKSHDWVVIYFENEQQRGQVTVVTETRAQYAGRRVVRGREGEGQDP